MLNFKKAFCQELESFQQATAPAVQPDAETADAQWTHLAEVAKPSGVVLEGLLGGVGKTTADEPKDCPKVASVLPTILVQYLAWQRLCELSEIQQKVTIDLPSDPAPL